MINVQIILIAATAIAIARSQCIVGDTVEPTESFITNGQYVNLNEPASCSGNLTAWHFCYYRDSIDTTSTIYTIFLRVWRKVQGSRYSLVSTAEVRGTPNQNAGDIICVNATLTEDQYVAVEQGDVIAVYLPFTIPTVSILASGPAVPQELHQDVRGSTAFSATELRRSDLTAVTIYGLHLQADIAPDIATPTMPPTLATTNTGPTTVTVTTTMTTEAETGAITPQTTMSSENAGMIGDDGTIAPLVNGPVIAAVIVVVLLVLLGVVVVVTITLICYQKRKHGSFKGCLQRSGTNLLAIDNLIYRVGSDRIPIEVPAKKDVRPMSNASSQQYDIPHDNHSRTLYNIPQQNGTPSIHESQNYSVVRSLSQTASIIQGSNAAGTPSIHESQNYSVARPLSQTASIIQGSNAAGTPSIHESQNYSVVRPLSQTASIIQGSNAAGENTVGDHNGHNTDTFLQSTATGDYIFMDNNDTEAVENEENDRHDGNYGDDEAYIYLSYSSVEYHKLLSEATDKDEESENPFCTPPSSEDEIYVVLSEQHIKVIPRKAVEIEQLLGSGHFGNVNKGMWTGSKGTLQVAAKSLNEGASQTDKVRLLQEAAIMGQFKHPNITNLHGIVTQGGPLLLLMEYMPKGDLKKYLTKLRPEAGNLILANVPHLLVSFSQQVALGMHYLASKGFVHRDLAARNIFISAEDTCKIGDFGMSRDLSENGCYTGRGGKVPLKWMAPEAIHRRIYSLASDVWSYGCVLFEMWSLGRKPFRGIDSSKTLSLIDSGYRLPPPPGCPFIIYDLMIKCWHPVAGCRPKYRDVLTSLLQEETKVLEIPVGEASSHPQACLLGASLEAGGGMYLGLQQCYNADASDENDPDYEYGETD